jgi:hypothetical protein
MTKAPRGESAMSAAWVIGSSCAIRPVQECLRSRRDVTKLCERLQEACRLFRCGGKVSADHYREVQDVRQFLGQVEAVRLGVDEFSPDVERLGDPHLSLVTLPGRAGQVGQPFEEDRQVAGVGGVARLGVRQSLPDRLGLLDQLTGPLALPCAPSPCASPAAPTSSAPPPRPPHRHQPASSSPPPGTAPVTRAASSPRSHLT